MLNPRIGRKEIKNLNQEIRDYDKEIGKIHKKQKDKPKIGVYALTSCYGCQLSIAMISKVLEIYDSVDIISFYMLSSNSSMHEKVDIAFVEGSVSTEKDLEELKEIRKNAKTLVAIGACAINGGVQSWVIKEKDYAKLYKEVYNDEKIEFDGLLASPIEQHVKVDFKLPGCPPEEEEILYFISTFLFGTWPEEKDYPVCQECRLAGNTCILIEYNKPCLGPVTTAGCDARCIKFNIPCIGCRGPVENDTAWFDSLALTFKEKGFTKEYIRNRMAIFGAHHPKLDEMIDKIFKGEK
ncbi:MAG: sulfhydrogenase 1 subunit delta [Asgard group archaeon]|nr:sulfhydrogenase 1 subunit delta [Asgard group archaeon]